MIENIETVQCIELYHPDIPVWIQIEPHLNDAPKFCKLYWGTSKVLLGQWFTTTVITGQSIPSRTTWEDGTDLFLGYQEKWDHLIGDLDQKLAAYQRAGYLIAKIRRF